MTERPASLLRGLFKLGLKGNLSKEQKALKQRLTKEQKARTTRNKQKKSGEKGTGTGRR